MITKYKTANKLVENPQLMDKTKRKRLMYNQRHGKETISIDRYRDPSV